MNVKTIGELNGPWALLTKFVLATYGPLLAAQAWLFFTVIRLQAFSEQGDRFTMLDGQALYRDLDERIDKLPPPHVEEALRENARQIRETKDMLQKFERAFSAEYLRKSEAEMILKAK